MALSKVDLAGILECKICLDTFYKPKHLNCGHAYCKDCLDGVLVFQDDGSAELKCPLRCSKTTIVDQHETTSSLANVYTLTDLLDKMSVGGKVKYLCQQSKKCKQIISYSCTTCSAKICDKCQNMHSCVNKSVTNISFNEKLQQLQPLCKQHNSLAKFVCIDCENLFVCVYCTHRQHKNHRTKSIADFGLEAKQWFQSFITSFDETKIILENLTRKYDDALKHVQKEREIFALKIKERKFKRIEEYINMLSREEADLLKLFHEKSKEFKAKLISAGFVDNAIVKEFTDYVQGFNLKSHFELVAEKLEIERQLRKLSSHPKTVPTFNSQLHQMNKEDHFTNPLGKMEISLRDITTVGINSSEFSVYNNVIDECESQPDHSQLVTDLMNLVESLKEYEKPTPNAIQASAKELKIDVKPRSLQLAKKCYSFKELVEIIKNDDDKKLQTILIDNPWIVKMRDYYKNTLLMNASRQNKPSIVKCLIDAGSDVYAVSRNKWNAYHYSARFGHYEVLKLLINHDVTSINNGDTMNYTPLHYASHHGHIECLKLLLSVPHIDVNIRNNRGETAYDVADNYTIKRLIKEHQQT
ncbi:E3 ubiquitin-protein ligase TRIM56-like [Hydractinia symbiolongicarpus]|uniref:E3 ubiquitin-protein ligase TRIM56-like n=1 Tax=Hydractinia symbiolongicarpus TaxID=13093 RepID=UPI00254B3DFC|nr:E3 ubiquitin-protein ligase TRIM56-like [Hydractinia symbiolongicarpus]